MAGRREVPVDPAASPVQRFAFGLRELRAEAGGITYRSLARRAGYSVTTLSQAAAGERLPTLPVTLAYVGACGGDLTQWEARWKEAVTQSTGDGARDDDGPLAPYRGLARFEAGDSSLFFGREQLTADLVDLLRRRRFAAVFGPSGSGKSSLLRAGLIPVLQSTQDQGLCPAAIRILTPGEHPARSHASVLTPAAARDDGGGADTFVIIDQFEEVFTLCHDPDERAHFIDLLLTARQPASRLRVLLAVRGDFYGRCAEHRNLAEALRDANLLAGSMSQAELRDAVVKPATAAGLTVERALTARLVEEVADAPGGLPLLSHALLETWRRRRGKTLTMTGYEAAGRLDGAIAKTAEEVYGRFTAAQAAVARRVLLRMVAPGDGTTCTRRPVRRAELPGTGQDDTVPVVEALAKARLLTLDGDTVEMAHETLITAWPRLRGWIEEDRQRLRVLHNLTEAAHAWQELGREREALYRGSRLAAAQEHFGGAPREDLTDLEHAFLDAGREHEQRGRRRYRLVLTAVTAALCLALVAAGLAVGQRQHAVTAQRLAESRQLAAQSSALLDSDPDLAALLAVHAYRTSPTREATAALYTAAALPLRKRLVTGTDPVDSMALSPDGHSLATHSRDGRIGIWDLPAGRLRHTFTAHGASAVSAFGPDGRVLAVATETTIGMWDTTTGRKIGTLRAADGAVRGMAFSPDGQTVAAASPSAVRVWDVATGLIRHHFKGHPDPQAVAFGPGGRTVAAAGLNGLVRVWDTVTGRAQTVRDGGLKGTAVAFSPDGRTYAMARTDGSVQLREVATGAIRQTLRDGSMSSREITFAPDGHTLAVPGPENTVRRWDTTTGTALSPLTTGHRGRGILHVTLGADGRTMVTSNNLDPAVRVHSLSADQPRTTLEGRPGTSVSNLALSPDSRTVTTFGQGPPGWGSVQLWDARTGDRKATMTLDTDPAPGEEQQLLTVLRPGGVGFDPTGRALAARVGEGGRLEVRDIATGRLRRSSAVGGIGTTVFSPDGSRLVLVGQEGSLRIWDLSAGVLHTLRPGHSQPVRAVAFAPDGRTLAVVAIKANGDQVTLLDAATRRTQRTIEPGGGSPLLLAFSPDGHTLATVSSGTGSVKTWSTRTGRLQGSFSAGAAVTSLTFGPGGRTLALGGTTGVRLWDLDTSQNRSTIPTRTVTAAAFSPDGHTLAIATGSAVGLWNVELPDPALAVRTICEAVNATLTPLEQARYLHNQSSDTGCQPTAQ
ncbi:nSTAND1 domain-containing NTPase [Streptomyces griseoruber]|uniref:nSTAND1 domain-containing NTPase n=1 Tax=Streptomyces griseoruber TaxID=1943 RepID=UPI0007C746F2|nr:PQQ-binding-like beta-propeller repeat protein [Streptomyces griseoruber]